MTSSVEHQRLADDYWFQVPSTSLCATDVLRRAYDKNVVLESLFIRGLSAYGTIRVTNISFNKWVAVRFTTDEWRTTHSLNAHYLMHYDDTNTDSFQFKLTVPAEALPSSPRTLIFAILYRTEYDRFWDNNRSQDYRLKILRRYVFQAVRWRSSEAHRFLSFVNMIEPTLTPLARREQPLPWTVNPYGVRSFGITRPILLSRNTDNIHVD